MIAARTRGSRASRSARFTGVGLAYFFPGGGVPLEGVWLGLVLVADLLMEPAGDHLVGHCLGDAQLGERFHLVGHNLVARRLEGAQDLFDRRRLLGGARQGYGDRKSTRLNSSHSQISYAVFCLKKKKS